MTVVTMLKIKKVKIIVCGILLGHSRLSLSLDKIGCVSAIQIEQALCIALNFYL